MSGGHSWRVHVPVNRRNGEAMPESVAEDRVAQSVRETTDTSRDVVELAEGVMAEMIVHAREKEPNECCGLLIGTSVRIESVARARNLEDSPTRYRVNPADHFLALRAARAAGRQVVGSYHSHPASPARPSAADTEEAMYPDYVYVIVSLADPEGPTARGFRFRDGNVTDVQLIVG